MTFLQVLTRCYKRPDMLERNLAGMRAQTDNDWTQTLLHDEVGRGVPWANAMLGAYAPELVGDYIWVLDDDDICIHPTLVEELKIIVAEENPDVIMLRGTIGHWGILPDEKVWKKKPIISHIGMPCFVVRREIWQQYAYAFRQKLAADFMFINEVFRKVKPGRIYWHDVLAFNVQRISSGAKEHGALAVVSCVCNRPERLHETLAMLEAQRLQIFDLILINNNPDLAEQVDEAAERSSLPITVVQNTSNRGSYARIEMMHKYCNEYDYFLTLDDDANIGPLYVAQWWERRNKGEVRAWQGFVFPLNGNYWQRYEVNNFESCHYAWGSGTLVPSWVVEDAAILDLDERYWMAEDLWLSYFANHIKGVTLRKMDMTLEIVVDGKDAYHALNQEKIEFLDELRATGWDV